MILDILFLILRKFSRWGETYIIKNVVIYLKSSKSNLTLWRELELTNLIETVSVKEDTILLYRTSMDCYKCSSK
jgi:hypothetical protein